MTLETAVVLIMALSLLLVATVVFLPNSIPKLILMILIAVTEIIGCITALVEILESMSDKWRAVLGGATSEEIAGGHSCYNSNICWSVYHWKCYLEQNKE